MNAWTLPSVSIVLVLALGCGGDDAQAPPTDDGEPVAAGCQAGALPSTSAPYQICFPQQWNGDLVVYAHGYVPADAPLAIPDDRVDGQPISEIVTGLGYGYATTSYRANGLVADLAVDDVTELAAEVRRRFRPDPSRTFVVGVSEGGLVAALAAERHGDVFAGAVAACGPIGDFAAQIDYLGDFRVLFDYFFPGVIPGPPMDVPESVRASWTSTYAPAVVAALQANIPATIQLLSVAHGPIDPGNVLTAGETVVGALWYDIFALPDARIQLGGQPYDNIGRVYAGSADDGALNAGVTRVAADPAARDALGRFETSGLLTVPLAAVHTVADPIVPASQSSRYAEKAAAAGSGDLVDVTVVARYGHCTFQPTELLNAFASVVGRATAARTF
jgi:pimeloyl-ACP methyl ester carboxylesterase